MTSRLRPVRILRAAAAATGALILVPATTSAHQLSGRYESPLPLAAYLGGAAVAVALSFAIVILRSGGTSAASDRDVRAERLIRVPSVLRNGVRALGLAGWLWIVIQGVTAGSSSDADVGSLFLWTYGWVALPLVAAFAGPAWEWLDPFATLHDLGAAALRRLGRTRWPVETYPTVLGRWPAVAALVVIVWLELVYPSARGGRVLAVALVLYTAWTLLMMAQYGRDTWRRNGEAFSAWFGILGRIAPLEAVDAGARTLRIRRLGRGLLTSPWVRSELVLVAAATGSILFDGLSQTQIWFDVFGTPSVLAGTVQLTAFLGAVAGLVLLVARITGIAAMAAGLVPIALGYLIAHYFTALAFDGQRALAVVSDPFNVGWDLFGTATFEPNDTWIPFGIVWAVELLAVVGGHIGGAVVGHRAAVLGVQTMAPAPSQRRRPSRGGPAGAQARTLLAAGSAPPPGTWSGIRARQIPLAILMVALTTLTLWSLGQNLVHTSGEASAIPPVAGTRI